jgi:hypothetical protein
VHLTPSCGARRYVEGWANGKNGYGGYGGFKIFVVRIEGGRGEVLQADGKEFAEDGGCPR